MSTELETRPETSPEPAPDELESAEEAARAIRRALTIRSAELNERRDEYNALWQRLLDVERGAARLRRARAPGVEFGDFRVYHIDEAGREE